MFTVKRPHFEEKSTTMNHTTRAALLLIALLFIVPACQAQTEFPNTPAGNQAKSWLAAFNAGDADKYKEFVRNNFPLTNSALIGIWDFER